MRPNRSTWYQSISLLGLALTLSPHLVGQYDPHAPEPIRKLPGSLVLHGGGNLDPQVRETFIALAGGDQAKIIVIPSAAAEIKDDEELLKNWKSFSVANIKVIHAESRDEAESDESLTALTEATGVWFNGGAQERLEALYVGNAFEAELLKVVQRGGVVGGSSAGAAIASKVMISRGEKRQGFDLLPESIVDQHFAKRQRESRLLKILEQHPERLGFGIDEDTALIVRGRRLFVLGSSAVDIYMAKTANHSLYQKKLRQGEVADLIALHRTLLARQAKPFPPSPAPTPHVPQGTLFIVGGGGISDGLLEQFIERAGGPEAPIVYVPCLEEEDASRDRFDLVLRRAGAKNVTKLHTKDRDRANGDEDFLAPLRTAKGLWFGGGRQWNFVDSYQHTQAHALMLDVLRRGGAIGGSSAGASIQGDYMPRGDPLGNLNIMAPGYEQGLGFLCGVGIDQHFAQRNRFSDMTSLIKTYPQLLGIGIDESTALVVQGHVAEVVGNGKVAFYDVESTEWKMAHQPTVEDTGTDNVSFSLNEKPAQDYIHLGAGGRFDLRERKVLSIPK